MLWGTYLSNDSRHGLRVLLSRGRRAQAERWQSQRALTHCIHTKSKEASEYLACLVVSCWCCILYCYVVNGAHFCEHEARGRDFLASARCPLVVRTRWMRRCCLFYDVFGLSPSLPPDISAPTSLDDERSVGDFSLRWLRRRGGNYHIGRGPACGARPALLSEFGVPVLQEPRPLRSRINRRNSHPTCNMYPQTRG